MSALTNNTVSSTYQSLLKTVDNGIVDSTLKNVTDGLGNPTAISLDSNTAAVNGELIVTGSAAVNGNISSNNTVASPVFMTPQTVTDNVDIPSNYNAFLISPVNFAGTVTVGLDSNLQIL